MRCLPPLAPLALTTALTGTLLAAQQVVLPHDAGMLSPPAAWTVLRAAELDAAERITDPRDEPARGLLRDRIETLRKDQRTAEHVLLHATGEHGRLRLVDAYSAAGGTSAAALRGHEAAAQVRGNLEPALRAGGATIEFLGHDDPQVFATGSLRLRFRRTTGAASYFVHHHVVPAGDRTAYFEVAFFPDDAPAEAQVAALLRTFDGARDGADRTLRNMLLGGLLGGATGVMAAMWRRRRMQRALQSPDAARPASPGRDREAVTTDRDT